MSQSNNLILRWKGIKISNCHQCHLMILHLQIRPGGPVVNMRVQLDRELVSPNSKESRWKLMNRWNYLSRRRRKLCQVLTLECQHLSSNLLTILLICLSERIPRWEATVTKYNKQKSTLHIMFIQARRTDLSLRMKYNYETSRLMMIEHLLQH